MSIQGCRIWDSASKRTIGGEAACSTLDVSPQNSFESSDVALHALDFWFSHPLATGPCKEDP